MTKREILRCSYAVITFLTQCFVASLCAQEIGGALTPPEIVRPITDEYADSARQFQGIPGVEVAKDGGIWACWYSGGAGEGVWNYVLVAHSDDGGETWSKPLFAVDHPQDVRVYDANLWNDPNGVLHLYWNQTEETNNDGRLGVWTISTSTPELGVDAQWTEPRRLCNGIMLNKPIVDSRSRWLFPVSHKPNGRKYRVDPNLLGAAVYVSSDEGATLYQYGIAEVPLEQRGCDEHCLVEKEDGSFWMLSRVVDGIGESFSKDGGRVWSTVAVSSLGHSSSRFFIRRLKSGALILVKHGAIGEKLERRERLTAFLSTDDGASWRGGLVLDERDDVSYPDGAQFETER